MSRGHREVGSCRASSTGATVTRPCVIFKAQWEPTSRHKKNRSGAELVTWEPGALLGLVVGQNPAKEC